MKITRIRQLEKVVRALEADGYDVEKKINSVHNLLMIIISLGEDDAKEIMAQWNDLKRISG